MCLLPLFLYFTLVASAEKCLQTCCEDLQDISRPQQTYTFFQDTGHFIGGEGINHIDTIGYSGIGEGKNNPKMECTPYTGPPPATTWKLGRCQNSVENPHTGQVYHAPCSFTLEPLDESKVCGRPGFFIHGCWCCTEGDTTVPPRDGCSLGCIVIAIQERMKLRVGDIIEVKNYENEEKLIRNQEL